MAFILNDIVVDRIQSGVAMDFTNKPLYALTQLADATINITAESTDATDARGTLIKRFWRAKTGEFTANNAMLNLSIIGAASGEGKVEASVSNQIEVPAILYKSGKTTEVTLNDLVEGSVHVNGFGNNGALGKEYTSGLSASSTEFQVDGTTLHLPTDTEEEQFQIIYTRKVKSGGMISNRADKFPGTVKLLLKALAVDPCSADTLRGIYIEIPSFQVSPEIEINLTTDAQLAYSGAMQVDYCSADKSLYRIYWAEADVEDEEEGE